MYSFDGVNTPGTPLGTSENFSFPARSSGRYVRFTPILVDDQWCSINEVTSLVLMLAVTLVALELIWIWWIQQVFGRDSKMPGDNPPFSDKKRILEEGSRIDWTSDRARIHAAPVNVARLRG